MRASQLLSFVTLLFGRKSPDHSFFADAPTPAAAINSTAITAMYLGAGLPWATAPIMADNPMVKIPMARRICVSLSLMNPSVQTLPPPSEARLFHRFPK